MEQIRGVFEKVKDSGIWWIRWTDPNGVKRREKVGRRSDAKTLLDKRKTEKLQQVKLPELSGQSILFSTLLNDALEHSTAENGEQTTHELKLKIERIRPEWGSRKAQSITKQEIVRWLQTEKNKRNWTTATHNRWQACFSLVFRVGVDNEKISINPAARIRRKAEDNQKIRFLTPEEEGRIQNVLAKKFPSYLPSFLISVHSGMRAGEQWRLKWTDVDLTGKRITVRKQKHGQGKERHIPLNTIALGAFQALLPKGKGKARGPVFINSEGTPMTAHRDWFDPTVRDAEVEDFTWHCNRHTFASRLVMSAIDLRTVAELMGHRTIQMTMRYAHLAPAHNQSAVDRMAAMFGARDTKSDTAPEELQIEL